MDAFLVGAHLQEPILGKFALESTLNDPTKWLVSQYTGLPYVRIEKFTAKLQQALSDAQSLAVGRDHNSLAPVHLVQSMLRQHGGSVKPILTQMGVDTVAMER